MDFAILLVRLATALLALAKRAVEFLAIMRGFGNDPRRKKKRPKQ